MTRSTFLCLIVFSARAVTAAAPQSPVLELAGRSVELFSIEFSSVTCTEQVEQVKFNPDGKPALSRSGTYDYLMMIQWIGGELSLVESREERGGKSRQTEQPLLITQGFAALQLVFHPKFQPDFEFREEGEEMFSGQKAVKIHFSHIAGKPSPSALQLRGRDFPLPWEGTAWIDAASGAMLKIQANMQKGMEDTGLQQLSSEVVYAPVQFRDPAKTVLLPVTAIIEARTPRQHWRNAHRFMNYKQYSVETTTKMAAPAQ